MAKEKKKVGIKPVDEDTGKAGSYVRLHPDAIEEVVELPPVRVGGRKSPLGESVVATRTELKMRSDESDLGALVEMDEIPVDDNWEDPAGKSGKSVPWGWLVLLGCIFAGAIIWSLSEVSRSTDKQGQLIGEAKVTLEKETEEQRDAESVIDMIDQSVHAFFDSRSVEELLRYVRQPQRVAPLMEKYYLGKAPEPLRVEKILSLDPVTIDDHATFWMVSCELEGGETSQVVVEVISPKEVKVDWETFVAYQPMDWDEFARSRPGGYTGDFRVFVEPDNFYSYEFSDGDAFSSFRLTALRGEESLNGYVYRNSEIEAGIMDAIARNGGGSTPMILRLHLPKGLLSKRGVVVKELICPRWLFVDNPDLREP